jgi:hypothetical protein
VREAKEVCSLGKSRIHGKKMLYQYFITFWANIVVIRRIEQRKGDSKKMENSKIALF